MKKYLWKWKSTHRAPVYSDVTGEQAKEQLIDVQALETVLSVNWRVSYN